MFVDRPELRDIPDYEGLYAINKYGHVWGYKKHRSPAGWRKTTISWQGYERIQLRKDGRYHNWSVHRLVAMAFLPNPDGLPELNHKDGDKQNNTVENLEWCNHSHNIRHADRTGLRKMPSGRNHFNGKKTVCNRGHLFSGKRDANGFRFCEECTKLRQAKYKLEGAQL